MAEKLTESDADIPEPDSEEFVLRKRLPRRYPKRPNDVYISRKTDFRGQMARCRKLLESGKYDSIYVHGLGAAVDRAINVALQLKLTSADCVTPLEVSANTSTIDLIDDFIPTGDDREARTRRRRSSAIHIKVFRVGTVSSRSDSVQPAVCSSSAAEERVRTSAPVDTRTAMQQQLSATGPARKNRKKNFLTA